MLCTLGKLMDCSVDWVPLTYEFHICKHALEKTYTTVERHKINYSLINKQSCQSRLWFIATSFPLVLGPIVDLHCKIDVTLFIWPLNCRALKHQNLPRWNSSGWSDKGCVVRSYTVQAAEQWVIQDSFRSDTSSPRSHKNTRMNTTCTNTQDD